jgi:hypothetical protein
MLIEETKKERNFFFFIYLDSPPLNGNNIRKNPTSASNRSRSHFPYEKPRLHLVSSSSSSPSPPTDRQTNDKTSS